MSKKKIIKIVNTLVLILVIIFCPDLIMNYLIRHYAIIESSSDEFTKYIAGLGSMVMLSLVLFIVYVIIRRYIDWLDE